MKPFAALFLVMAACAHIPPPPPPEDTCTGACARLRELGCDGGNPTPGGLTCEEVCENAQDSGIVDVDVACIVRASTCEAADQCE